MEQIDRTKVDPGAAGSTFGSDYLGRTKGETVFEFQINTYPLESAEDGQYDEMILPGMPATVTIPLIYTDVENLSKVLPYMKIITALGGEKKLVAGNKAGTLLSSYAKTLTIHPIAMGADKRKDITIHKCYPKPGPINFSYGREGERIANVQFVMIPDEAKSEGEEYFTIGDPSIQEGA